MRKFTKRSAAIVTAAVVAVGGAGAAFAAWSLNSSENVQTTAGTATPLAVSGLAIVGTLVPGSTSSVQFNARNNNAFPVKVSNITYTDISTSNPASCPAYNLEQVPVATAALPDNLTFTKAGVEGDAKTINYANSLRLKADPDDGCQNATFYFKVNLTVASTNAA